MIVLRRLTSAEVAALITVLVIAAVMLLAGGNMFSPGALNAQSREGVVRGGVSSHAEVGKNCAACHVPPGSRQTMADRCLECHTNVRQEMTVGKAIHGLMTDGMQCRSCHTEHKGAHAPLTTLAKFDHDCAAFKLTGKHQAVDCKSCHTNNVFKGTSAACASCHTEPKVHLGRYGTDCVHCHTTTNWNATFDSLVNFNHDTTPFMLTGKHRTVACQECHKDNSTFKVAAQTCASCHAEPKAHLGRYGTDCAHCHATSTWLDHAYTPTVHHLDFALDHRRRPNNTCKTCHNDLNHFDSYTCYNCHEHTPAKMERTHARRNIVKFDDCAGCHAKNKNRRAAAATSTDERFDLVQSLVMADRPIDAGSGCPEARARNDSLLQGWDGLFAVRELSPPGDGGPVMVERIKPALEVREPRLLDLRKTLFLRDLSELLR